MSEAKRKGRSLAKGEKEDPGMADNMIVRLLREKGPMTTRDIALELDRPYERMRARVGAARKLKQIHVVRWEYRYRWTAVYAVGPGEDAPMPPPKCAKKIRTRPRPPQKKVEPEIPAVAVNSIFDLGRVCAMQGGGE